MWGDAPLLTVLKVGMHHFYSFEQKWPILPPDFTKFMKFMQKWWDFAEVLTTFTLIIEKF